MMFELIVLVIVCVLLTLIFLCISGKTGSCTAFAVGLICVVVAVALSPYIWGRSVPGDANHLDYGYTYTYETQVEAGSNGVLVVLSDDQGKMISVFSNSPIPEGIEKWSRLVWTRSHEWVLAPVRNQPKAHLE